MLHYPKIPSSAGCPGGRCVAFDKIDGTNLHWSWDRDFGWHAFGTRRDQFDLTEAGIEAFHRAHPGLDDCVALFQRDLAADLDRLFREHAGYTGYAEMKVFTEYAGPLSFAGRHQPGDAMELVLFDVLAGTDGLVGPVAFVRDFGHLRIPRVVYQGKFTGQLTENVRAGRWGVKEGVVVKGWTGGDDLWMCKIKTLEYLERLKRSFGAAWQDYWE
jgi:hypothetical protein